MPGSYDIATFKPLTFHDAVPRMLSGEDTPRAYLERCLKVIEEREPAVKAWQSMRIEGALADADASTARYAAGKPLSPIDGVPIGIKDLVATADLPTSMGIEGNENARTPHDSASVHALKAAGAVILGKLTTTQLGSSWPSKTTNPFDEERTPGGSSAGSGAAIGAGMLPVAIGTQVGGSILRPASFSANFAIKPTQGAINRGERLGYSQGVIGVHAGCLTDMWRVSIEIAKRSNGDPGAPGLFGKDDFDPVKPVRLAVLEGEGWPVTEPSAIAGFEHIVQQLRERGVTIIRRSDEPVLEAFEKVVSQSLLSSAKIINFENRWNLENLKLTMPELLSPAVLQQYDHGKQITIGEYRELLVEREEARRRFAGLAAYCDAIISPMTTGPAPIRKPLLKPGVNVMVTGSPIYAHLSSWLGGPALTMPLMEIERMPVGVHLMGQWHEDERLCGLGQWIVDNVRPYAA